MQVMQQQEKQQKCPCPCATSPLSPCATKTIQKEWDKMNLGKR
jgi:hypothetical protein